MSEQLDIGKLKNRLEKYAKDRDWEQFHNPKNIAMALSVEASELVEIFQWLSLDQAEKLKTIPEKKGHVAEELADILSYVVLIAKYMDIDLVEALEDKHLKNSEKYPVDKARGNAKKYNEF